MIVIDVAKEFSKTPFGRYKTDSQYSAEEFREKLLLPKLNNGDSITIDFSRISLGVGSSFLEEAFGGLVRRGVNPAYLKNHIKVIDRMGLYDEQVRTFIEAASKK
ncbi:MAG: STAS-like domain-containing protein [Pseudoalteromonas prydzensis]|uniref:STAS-like domain-containing protein n=1 Tax=Pseudoalteromonas prydzensis TaxID=182141 RepID=A0ABR9FHA3_9GAMM|nr:STAS-like domain-containing protein [Pseudoalteromonas prydzensis]MBE0456195.1 STAS-like domain-containing protein [Pseudoalteromonas prydzensis]